MSYLLDTDTCSLIVRGVARVSSRYLQNLGSIYISAASVTDLEMWVLRPQSPLSYGQTCLSFLQSIAIIDVNEPIAHRAAMLGCALRRQRMRAGLADLLIAATVLVHGMTLVSRGKPVFANLPGLSLIDWAAP